MMDRSLYSYEDRSVCVWSLMDENQNSLLTSWLPYLLWIWKFLQRESEINLVNVVQQEQNLFNV